MFGAGPRRVLLDYSSLGWLTMRMKRKTGGLIDSRLQSLTACAIKRSPRSIRWRVNSLIRLRSFVTVRLARLTSSRPNPSIVERPPAGSTRVCT